MASRNLTKHPAEVSSAELADIFGRKALKQHLANHCGKKSFPQVRPHRVRALASAGGEQIRISADTGVIDARLGYPVLFGQV